MLQKTLQSGANTFESHMIFQCLIEQEYRNALMFSWSGGTLFSEGILFRLLLVPDTRTALKNIISHFFFFAKRFGGRFSLWRLWWWWERVGLGEGGGLNTFYICLCPRAWYLYDHWFKTLFLFLFLKKFKRWRGWISFWRRWFQGPD